METRLSTPVSMNHSGLGIASFVIAVVGGLAVFVMFGIAGYMEVTTPGGIDESSPAAIFLGLGLIFVWAVVLVGLILGVVSLFNHERRRLFSGLGLGLNATWLLLSLAILMLGLSQS